MLYILRILYIFWILFETILNKVKIFLEGMFPKILFTKNNLISDNKL